MKEKYGNYKVYHPNGGIMFFCDKKKYNWYLRKNLANKIGDKKIQLTFEPKGNGEQEKYLHPKKNICVITGTKENLTKHHIVPSQYRKLFPDKYKSNNSKDVVLLNKKTHDDYELIATEYKKELLEKYLTNDEINFNKNLNTAQKIAQSIKKYSNYIPSERLEIMEEKLEKSLKILNVNSKYYITKYNVENIKPIDENQLVVDRVGVEDLIIKWNLHFLKYGKPKFLPKNWDPYDVKIVKLNKKKKYKSMEKLIELKKLYPNWTDLGKAVRKEFKEINVNGKLYYVNKDFPNDMELGKFIESVC
jgi:hypothetical protein